MLGRCLFTVARLMASMVWAITAVVAWATLTTVTVTRALFTAFVGCVALGPGRGCIGKCFAGVSVGFSKA